ncbi:histone-like nucleoid-structuring protein Lsr2 [Streptomyces sp. NPDC020192]|uniref:Lsr2 dimerization domain-containing protein n=1 Tax=Streptomyces sp. NPDC020192 TaxID=3365066 RepID=UPI003793D8DD
MQKHNVRPAGAGTRVDGVSYEIGLSAASYENLESTLSPFVKAARRTSSGRRVRSRKALAATRKWVPAATFSDAEPDPAEIRRRAKDRKIAVPARGRISRSVREQFLGFRARLIDRVAQGQGPSLGYLASPLSGHPHQRQPGCAPSE